MIPRHAAALAEALGTGMLVTAVVGSGIMAERLAGGNVALALLANTIATGAILLSLIFTLAPLSGAHLNPAVTFCMAVRGLFEWRRVPAYIAAQFAGGNCRNVPSARDVCSACFLGGTPSARGLATTDQRICGDVWTALSDLGMLTEPVQSCDPVGGGGLHNGGLLVYFFYFVRQSRRHTRKMFYG